MTDLARRSSRTSMRSKQLGQLLAENGDVTTEQVAKAVKAQEQSGGMFGAILQRMGACGPDAIGHALARQVQVTDIQCEDVNSADDAIAHVPMDYCLKEKLCPFECLGNMICVVMGNPLNRKAIQDIEKMSGSKVKAFKAPWPKIQDLIERAYNNAGVMPDRKAKESVLDDLSFDLEPESAPLPAKSVSTSKTASAQRWRVPPGMSRWNWTILSFRLPRRTTSPRGRRAFWKCRTTISRCRRTRKYQCPSWFSRRRCTPKSRGWRRWIPATPNWSTWRNARAGQQAFRRKKPRQKLRR